MNSSGHLNTGTQYLVTFVKNKLEPIEHPFNNYTSYDAEWCWKKHTYDTKSDECKGKKHI